MHDILSREGVNSRVDYNLPVVSVMSDRLDLQRMAKQIAAAVRRLRKARDWTQERLADAIGVHRTTVVEIEKGTRDHDHSTIQAIADAFEVQIGEITGETADSSGLSRDALEVARLFDKLEDEDRVFVKKFVRRFFAGPPSSR